MYLFILLEGIGKSISFNSILNLLYYQILRWGMYYLALIYHTMTIMQVTTSRVISKTEDCACH